jgi:hypothetical protein
MESGTGHPPKKATGNSAASLKIADRNIPFSEMDKTSNISRTSLTIFFLWLYSPTQALAASMKLSVSLQLLDLRESAGLLGWVISSSQGLCLYTNTEKRI